jgi:hypothetical protein
MANPGKTGGKTTVFSGKNSHTLFHDDGTSMDQTFESKFSYAKHHWMRGNRVEFEATMAAGGLDAAGDIVDTLFGNSSDETLGVEGVFALTSAARMKLWAKTNLELLSNANLGLTALNLDLEARTAHSLSTPVWTLQGYGRTGTDRITSAPSAVGGAAEKTESYVTSAQMFVAAMRQRFRDTWIVDGEALAVNFDLNMFHTEARESITRHAKAEISDTTEGKWAATAGKTVELTAGTTLTVAANAVQATAVAMMALTAGGALTVTGATVAITSAGAVTVTVGGTTMSITAGGVEITGQVSVTGDIVLNGQSVAAHVHGGVTSGSSSTAPFL